MPIYAYKCSACGFAKDVLQKLSDAPLTDCPQCGASEFSKQVTAAGFQLKGSGWYVTDFRDGGKKADKSDKSDKATNGDKPANGAGASADGAAGSASSSGADAPATAPAASPAPAPAAASTSTSTKSD
jgi:putative FmdB family regulatory protein